MSRGIEAFKTEREHQIEDKGYTAEHDAQHGSEVLLRMGACYADFAVTEMEGSGQDEPHSFWPEGIPWNPGDSPLETLEKAGALLAAGYDQLWFEMTGVR